MKTLLSFTLLLFALSAFGQPAPINRRAMIISGLASTVTTPITPQILTNLSYWWVAADLTNGWTITNQFIDRIQSRHMDQSDVAKAPTNANPGGIWFNGSTTVLVNGSSPPSVLASSAQGGVAMLIFNPVTQVGDCGIVMQTDRGLGMNTSPALRYSGNNSGGPNTITAMQPNHTVDVLMYLTSTNTTWFTNGVPVVTNTTTAPGDPFSVAAFGWVSTSSAYFAHYKGFFIEWIMWTNASRQALYGSISNLHYYATNTYSYTP